MTIGMKRVLALPFEDAVVRVPAVLAAQGFGILTEIDLQQTLAQKLQVPFRRYRLFGACNPELAEQALAVDLDAGVLLPCSVALYKDDDGRTVVTTVDPLQSVSTEEGRLRTLAERVKVKLEAVLDQLMASAAPEGARG